MGQLATRNEPVLVTNLNMEAYNNWTLFLVRLDYKMKRLPVKYCHASTVSARCV